MAEYVITDGKRFIYKNLKGKYVPGSGEMMADKFTKQKAENILFNYLPKMQRKTFRLEKIDVPPTNIKQIKKEDISDRVKDIPEEINGWIKKASDLNGLFVEATERKNQLCTSLSDIDKELSDIDHYLENADKLNACQLCKVSQLRKPRLDSRRKIKDEIEILNIILDKKVGESISDEINKKIELMKTRTYEPRKLKELFDL